MKRTYIKDIPANIGKEIIIKGWVDVRRDMGKLIFLDIRDMTGRVQAVALTIHKEAVATASILRSEWVIEIKGKVNERPPKTVNKNEANGAVELEILDIKVLNKSETPPVDVRGDGSDVNEELRLKYRYLDLRRPRMQKNIRSRDKIISFFRDYMHRHDFVEVETPIMMKGTPEGSREYVVPSRLENGKFYVLPQSPQQFKQLLMVAGFEKYFQIARCMRDEDSRGDRQPEFTQLDFEMSFVTRDDVLDYTEGMFIELVKTLYPHKKITQAPFPVLTYAESMKKFGSDKPDMRKDKKDPNELAFAWVVDFPMFEKDKEGNIQAAHHPFCSIKEEDTEKFMTGKDIFSVRANSYDLVLNGFELSSGSIRIHQADIQKKVFEYLDISPEDQKARFGHMLEAFTFGTPPHGGFAPGVDRTVMLLENEPNIREVIAFPKNGEGKDLMMKAPAEISKKQLDELGLQLKEKKKGK